MIGRLRGRLGLIALGTMAASPVLAEDTILPGYWESRNVVSFPLQEESTSRQCITADKVEQFLSGPRTRNFQCRYSRAQVGGGTIEAAGDCVDKSGLQSTIAVRGAYTPTSFQLDAEVRVNLAGLPVPVNASTRATRIADACPPDAR